MNDHSHARARPAVLPSATASPSLRNYYVLLVLTMILMMSSTDRALPFALLEPMKRDLGLSDAQSGFIAGLAYSLFYAIGSIPLGLLADRWGRLKVIALCLVFWSGLTALCGVARSYFELALARAGVGLGEAGGGPASMAIVSSIFPERRRALMISLLYLGSPLGLLLAFGGGGRIASHYGWRYAYFAAAALGAILSAVVVLTVRDRPEQTATTGRKAPPIKDVFGFISRQRSMIHLLMGAMLSQAVVLGVSSFQTSLLVRSYGLSLSQVTGFFAVVMPLATATSHVAAGWLADRLAVRDARWRVRLCSFATGGATIVLVSILATSNLTIIFIFFVFYHLLQPVYNGLVHAVVQSLVPPNMRSTAASANYVMTAAIGAGIGPLLVGMASDALTPVYGSDALRYALWLPLLLYPWALLHFWRAQRTLIGDLRTARLAEVQQNS